LIYSFDLDGTLCETHAGDYQNSEPIPERIAKVNELYYGGHTIIIDTARASKHFDLTKSQLIEWGIEHHLLRVGEKIFAEVYVDDRGVNANEFFK